MGERYRLFREIACNNFTGIGVDFEGRVATECRGVFKLGQFYVIVRVFITRRVSFHIMPELTGGNGKNLRLRLNGTRLFDAEVLFQLLCGGQTVRNHTVDVKQIGTIHHPLAAAAQHVKA